jgi:hypothetical protein
VRVAYVVGWPGGPASGPFKKVAAQTAEWADQGVEVGLFVLTVAEHHDAWNALAGARRVVVRARGPRLAVQKEKLLLDVQRWAPDVIYHRWSLAYAGLAFAVRRRTVVMEVNTDDVAEYDLMSPLKGRINRLTRGHVLRRVSGLAFVTDELCRSRGFAGFGRPSVVVGNGIRLRDVPELSAPDNARPRLLLIGQPNCPWHGTDKLIWLARRKPEWDFDVVGPDPSELAGAPGNVTSHGLLEAPEYARLLAAADIGLGTLALHRKDMDEASPLKVREYLATGLPVVIGYADTDFPDGADWLLSLPNTEDNVSSGLPAIEDFVKRWKGLRVPRNEVAHLDTAAKERSRIAFFQSLIGTEARP